ncbi:MAG TPA: hypothetical protein VF105_02465 [Gemmatimonadaceae bacterium]
MRKARDFTVQLGLAAAILTLGCGDSNPTSPPREIEVTVTSDNVGGDMDPDGYTLVFDSQSSKSVSVNATVRFSTSNGSHFVQLLGLAPNCSVDGPNPREVQVVAGEPQTVMIAFTVHCGAMPPGDPWGY